MSETDHNPCWRDATWLRERYESDGLTTPEMAQEAGCDPTTVRQWMEWYGIERDNNGHPSDSDYKDRDWLKKQHWDEEKSIQQIARDSVASYSTIQHWFDKHDIPKRSHKDAVAAVEHPDRSGRNHPNWQEYASFGHRLGYEVWRYNRENGCGTKTLPVHRLVAVAEYGYEQVEGKVVHHRNRIKWDNRPENLELMDPITHAKAHGETDEA